MSPGAARISASQGVPQSAPRQAYLNNGSRPCTKYLPVKARWCSSIWPNDFLYPGGVIADAGGAEYQQRAQSILPALKRLVESAREAGVLVVYATDAHTPNDTELAKWPPHSMQGTTWADVADDLRPAPGDLVIGKTTYSPFVSTSIDERAAEARDTPALHHGTPYRLLRAAHLG